MSKRLVVPGELVSEEAKRTGDYVYSQNGKIYAACVGLVNDESPVADVVPLRGKYIPKINDIVIGIVKKEEFSGFMIDIAAFYPSFLSKKEFRYSLRPGEVVSVRIEDIDETHEAKISDVRTQQGGTVLTITPVKVPRLIGKSGSMLEVIKKGTQSLIVVGRNGRIWVKGGDINLLKKAIEKIENEAHLSNLTQKMEQFFIENPAKITESLAQNETDQKRRLYE
ncbi:MAG: exosome complex protein Rrp4 [Candidatus Diapherotrites archaeon]|nr:exosome complex protein Rrp4 [Candidatus Diapherotrites archaeon]